MSTQRSVPRLAAITPEAVRRGVLASRINVVADLGIDREQVLRMIGAPSTLRRRITERARLTRDESDRLARMWRIVGRAIEVFGSVEKAVRWLQRPVRTQPDGTTPFAMLDTDPGAEWVDERLTQIEHGLFA
ncbi:MAG TPA: antitoxin Xre/MbcA/ParS toxin-binding domain-containing protein [Rhodanobacteraceae bacterium]|nr:antitoxin Xre/MbcA/ParS toxin-binding domain-containing protein [Rhodanobacteraceae bacterium]